MTDADHRSGRTGSGFPSDGVERLAVQLTFAGAMVAAFALAVLVEWIPAPLVGVLAAGLVPLYWAVEGADRRRAAAVLGYIAVTGIVFLVFDQLGV